MNRPRLLLILGLVLMAALYLYDRDRRGEVVLRSTVIAVEDRDIAAGPDTWFVTVRIAGQDIELAPQNARPNVAPGDSLCVIQEQRAGQGDVFRRANADVIC